MPAVHAADRIRLDGKRQILMNSAVCPEDALSIGIGAGERLNSLFDPHLPDAVLLLHVD